jgi:phosphoglycolate phosphatase-like HAD superfamily hydrolase
MPANDPTRMKTIVWDLDDVLNHFTESWFAQAWQAEHPECSASFDQLCSNPPLEQLHAPLAEYLDSLDRFRLSAAAAKLAPDPAVLAWFQSQGGQFRHHVLTARPVKTVGPAAAWVFNHFGRWVRDFHFVPSPRPNESLPAYDADKAAVLARLGAVDFFIDDSPHNVAAAAIQGIRSFLFPQPWNRAELSIPQILAALSPDSPPDCPVPVRFHVAKETSAASTDKRSETRGAARSVRKTVLCPADHKVPGDSNK